MFLTSAARATSVRTKIAWPPAFAISRTTSLPVASVRPATTTLAPSLAKASAAALPMPVAPPVTKATLPSKLCITQLLSEVLRQLCTDRTLSGGHRVACRLPGFDAALERLDIAEALRLVLRCLTGSARLGGSGAVEDDLLVLRQGGKPGPERREREGSAEIDLAVLGLVVVGTHQKRLVGRGLATRFLNADPFHFRHVCLL